MNWLNHMRKKFSCCDEKFKDKIFYERRECGSSCEHDENRIFRRGRTMDDGTSPTQTQLTRRNTIQEPQKPQIPETGQIKPEWTPEYKNRLSFLDIIFNKDKSATFQNSKDGVIRGHFLLISSDAILPFTKAFIFSS